MTQEEARKNIDFDRLTVMVGLESANTALQFYMLGANRTEHLQPTESILEKAFQLGVNFEAGNIELDYNIELIDWLNKKLNIKPTESKEIEILCESAFAAGLCSGLTIKELPTPRIEFDNWKKQNLK